MEDGGVASFGSHRFPFYEWHAKLYLLIALARAAVDHPTVLAPYAKVFSQIALNGMPHILIQKTAADAALTIHEKLANTFNRQVTAKLKRVGRSPFPIKITNDYVQPMRIDLRASGDVGTPGRSGVNRSSPSPNDDTLVRRWLRRRAKVNTPRPATGESCSATQNGLSEKVKAMQEAYQGRANGGSAQTSWFSAATQIMPEQVVALLAICRDTAIVGSRLADDAGKMVPMLDDASEVNLLAGRVGTNEVLASVYDQRTTSEQTVAAWEPMARKVVKDKSEGNEMLAFVRSDRQATCNAVVVVSATTTDELQNAGCCTGKGLR